MDDLRQKNVGNELSDQTRFTLRETLQQHSSIWVSTTRLAVLATCLALSPAWADALDDHPQARFPVIKGYGGIVAAPLASERPDKTMRYQVVLNLTQASTDPGQPHPGLEKAARLVNLLAQDGILPQAGDLVVIVHGRATPLVLKSVKYHARLDSTNPNLELIGRLVEAGVRVNVCSQALRGMKIEDEDVDPRVNIDVSGLTTLATLQLKGFALIPD